MAKEQMKERNKNLPIHVPVITKKEYQLLCKFEPRNAVKKTLITYDYVQRAMGHFSITNC